MEAIKEVKTVDTSERTCKTSSIAISLGNVRVTRLFDTAIEMPVADEWRWKALASFGLKHKDGCFELCGHELKPGILHQFLEKLHYRQTNDGGFEIIAPPEKPPAQAPLIVAEKLYMRAVSAVCHDWSKTFGTPKLRFVVSDGKPDLSAIAFIDENKAVLERDVKLTTTVDPERGALVLLNGDEIKRGGSMPVSWQVTFFEYNNLVHLYKIESTPVNDINAWFPREEKGKEVNNSKSMSAVPTLTPPVPVRTVEAKVEPKPVVTAEVKPEKPTEAVGFSEDLKKALSSAPQRIKNAQSIYDKADRAYRRRLVTLTINAYSTPLFPGKKEGEGLRCASNESERETAIQHVVLNDDRMNDLADAREEAYRILEFERNAFAAAKLIAAL